MKRKITLSRTKTGRKTWLGNTVQNTGEKIEKQQREGGEEKRQRKDETGRREVLERGRDEARGEEQEEVRKRGGAGVGRKREERKIRSLFPFPGHDMINRFLLI